jgi:hypothetical protein
MALVGASQNRKMVASRRWLWIGNDRDLAEKVGAELRNESVAVEPCDVGDDLEDGLAELFARERALRLIVCDCSGERGSERGFFACRAARNIPVVLLAVGGRSEPDVVQTMMIGLCKALPESRVALLTDRVPEQSRPTGGAAHERWQASDLARLLLRIDRHDGATGRVFRLRTNPAAV